MHAAHHKVGTGNSTDVGEHKCFTLAGKVTNDECPSQMGDHRWAEKDNSIQHILQPYVHRVLTFELIYDIKEGCFCTGLIFTSNSRQGSDW